MEAEGSQLAYALWATIISWVVLWELRSTVKESAAGWRPVRVEALAQ